MKLADALKTSLGELRMQMLGAQVLFGFEFQGIFQDNFPALAMSGRLVDAAGLTMIVVVLALLLAVPCQHRLIENGDSTVRIYRVCGRYASLALLPLAGAIACDVFVASRISFGGGTSARLALITVVVALVAWYLLALLLRARWSIPREELTMRTPTTPLHAKIEQMLTEARVILPGAQALLGFQLVVMMTKAFNALPPAMQRVHLLALMSLALAITLLIAPAAIHRLTFQGADDARMYSVGSFLNTAALLPLAGAIGCDIWISFGQLFPGTTLPLVAALATTVLLLTLWYVVPLSLKRVYRRRGGHSSAS
jgi:hypothetical protein